MKQYITKKTIYGNIGYLIDLAGVHWLLIGFNWDAQTYIAQNWVDKSWLVQFPVNELVGAEILRDYWERMTPYEEVHFNTEQYQKNERGRDKKGLFRLKSNS